MDDTAAFRHIFDARPTRSNAADRLRIRDGAVIADLKARIRDLAAGESGDWRVAFSPVRHDGLTGRSLLDVALDSAGLGGGRLSLRIAESWVEMGDGAMESSIRDERNLRAAVEIAFRRAIRPTGGPAAVEPAAGVPDGA